MRLARARAGRHELGHAEALYRDVLSADPEHWDARRELVDLLAGRGQWNDAHELIEPLVARFPKRSDHLIAAVAIRENAGHPQAAVQAINLLLATDPPGEVRAAHGEKAEKLNSRGVPSAVSAH